MRYLTKSRFKVALECPTKLRYELDPDQYHNDNNGNPFLEALAKGGFQVGELAKLHYPEGVECGAPGYEVPLEETRSLIDGGQKVIFEAAIRSGHKFVRIDILEILPEEIRVIEVKSKSVNGPDERQFLNKGGLVVKKWRRYIEDVAFQVHVARDFFRREGYAQPVKGYLFCPDQQKKVSKSGMHERFLIKQDGERSRCVVHPGVTLQDIGDSVMTMISMGQAVDAVHADEQSYSKPGWECTTFEGAIGWMEQLVMLHNRGAAIPQLPVGGHCKKCAFQTPGELPVEGRFSGRRECFSNCLGWGDAEWERPKAWDVWNITSKTVIADGRWFMDELTEADFERGGQPLVDPDSFSLGAEKINQNQRQWIQVSRVQEGNDRPYLDREGLSRELASYTWPCHFIDFETTAPAIPFHAGYGPYQGLCFQYSHHILHEDGRVEHAGEFLGLGQGDDPTFAFIEALHDELSRDEGSVFMYSIHENTYLNYVLKLLMEASPFSADRTAELIRFIQDLAVPTGNSAIQWPRGKRKMVDMRVTVQKFFWHPRMAGSNSIKDVLPAVLNASAHLKEKYGKPVYGTDELKSRNFPNWQWVEYAEDGQTVLDPYKLLPPLGTTDVGAVFDEVERLYPQDEIGNGGAAMTAWSFMQFAEMGESERETLSDGLKRYCELDTLAMVMIMEYFRHETKHNG